MSSATSLSPSKPGTSLSPVPVPIPEQVQPMEEPNQRRSSHNGHGHPAQHHNKHHHQDNDKDSHNEKEKERAMSKPDSFDKYHKSNNNTEERESGAPSHHDRRDHRDRDGNRDRSGSTTPSHTRSLSPDPRPTFRSDAIYDRIEMIGKGTYGSVFKARAPTGELVALKKVRMDSENQGFPITAIREIKILQTLKHKNIVQLNDVVASEGAWNNRSGSSVYMVFPFMDHDLTGLLENPQARFSTPQIKYYLMHILEGVHYCHKRKILHRDIKGPNVLISNTGEVKLADFGLARFISDDEEQYTSNVVTLWYRPPELLFGAKKYSDAIDMWSVGCVFAEMLTAAPAFPGATEIDQIERIFKVVGSPTKENWPDFNNLPGASIIRMKTKYESTFQQRFSKYGTLAADLLQKLLQLDPSKRISAADALNHQYFWTDPRPIDPIKLPKYVQSHEYQARKRKQDRYEAQRLQQQQQQQQQQQHRQRQHMHQHQAQVSRPYYQVAGGKRPRHDNHSSHHQHHRFQHPHPRPASSSSGAYPHHHPPDRRNHHPHHPPRQLYRPPRYQHSHNQPPPFPPRSYQYRSHHNQPAPRPHPHHHQRQHHRQPQSPPPPPQ